MSQYLSPLLWSFLPSQITHAILPTLTSALPGLLPPAPRGTREYQRNFRLVITALTVGWLLYSLWSEGETEIDWYALLGVERRASDDELKKGFRTLSRKYHPDRQPTAAAAATASEHFILIRAAYETLTHPARRFAYDRFGPRSAKWLSDKKEVGVKELMWAGAQSSVGFYITSGVFMLVLGLSGRAREGAYWRNALLLLVLVIEASLILSPTSTSPSPFPLNTPIYAQVSLLRRLGADAGVAISQLAAVWADPSTAPEEAALSLATSVREVALRELADTIEVAITERGEGVLLNRMVDVVLLGRGEGRVSVDSGNGVVIIPRGDPNDLSIDELMEIAVHTPLPPPTPPLEPRRSARLSRGRDSEIHI